MFNLIVKTIIDSKKDLKNQNISHISEFINVFVEKIISFGKFENDVNFQMNIILVNKNNQMIIIIS